MKSGTLSTLLVALILLPAALAAAEPAWTWIHGRLPDARAQQGYLALAEQVHAYYQERGLLPGPMVAEEDLEAWPADHVVVLGPIEAFADPSRFGLPLTVEDGVVFVGAQPLDDPRTGIFLTDEAETRVAYLGLSLEGFRDIFTVPTGEHRCTVTGGRGRILYETDDLSQRRDLATLPFLPLYPSREDIAALDLPADLVVTAPVAASADLSSLDPDFAAWLDGFVAGQRVLFFGEGHWNQGVNRIFLRVVEHLLHSGRLRAVVLEVNYSFTGFYDHYAHEPDDERAARFLAARLHPLVSSPATLELLEMLRVWNRTHAGRSVRVGCLDMEWSRRNVAASIVEPYFRRLEPGYSLDFEAPDPLARADELLARARAEDVVGEYAFITPAYMEQVLANLRDTLALDDFHADRQQAIIRNVTEFNGELLAEGLAVFKGGGWHARKDHPDDEPFYRDAAYLHLEYPPTRGKVVSLRLPGIGYRFGELATIDLDERMASATNYNTYVHDFQEALADGRADPQRYYLLDEGSLDLLGRLMIQAGYASGQDVLRLVEADWARLEDRYGEEAAGSAVRDYDATVVVLRADIEVMRPRLLPSP